MLRMNAGVLGSCLKYVKALLSAWVELRIHLRTGQIRFESNPTDDVLFAAVVHAGRAFDTEEQAVQERPVGRRGRRENQTAAGRR